MKRPRTSITRSANDHAEAGAAALVTIAFRLPILFGTPSAAVTAEWMRAGAEKMAAGVEGALGAGVAMQSMAFRAAGGSLRPERLGEEWLAVADAAVRPAYRTVAANARRLSRGR